MIAISNWTPVEIADALVRVGWKLAILAAVVVLGVKLLEALKAKWSNK